MKPIIKDREKINVADLATNKNYPDGNDLCIDDWDTCDVVSRKSTDYDSEKGFNTYEVVIQRRSDQKFFMFEYTEFGHNGDDIREQTAEEVFPYQKTITLYR